MNEFDYQSVAEYAEVNGLTKWAIYKRIHKGRINFRKQGTFYLVKKEK